VSSACERERSAEAKLAEVVDGETQIRTGDTTIFSRVLYQLSYLAAAADASDT
jgi:hypothetical protein